MQQNCCCLECNKIDVAQNKSKSCCLECNKIDVAQNETKSMLKMYKKQKYRFKCGNRQCDHLKIKTNKYIAISNVYFTKHVTCIGVIRCEKKKIKKLK